MDDSTIFWAMGDNPTVIAKHAEVCGKEVEMTLPFEGLNLGEVSSYLLHGLVFFWLFISCVYGMI